MSKKGRIFLLDDDELIISMLARTLQKDGYEVGMLSSPKQAVEKICHVGMPQICSGTGTEPHQKPGDPCTTLKPYPIKN